MLPKSVHKFWVTDKQTDTNKTQPQSFGASLIETVKPRINYKLYNWA